MPSFQLRLRNRKRAVIANVAFDSEDTISALKIAHRVFEARRGACAGYELWQGERCISSASVSVGRPHMDLSAVERQVAADIELRLHDGVSQISEQDAVADPGAEPARQPKAAQGPLWLSKRERECMQLAARGHSDREIGKALGLSEKTVNEYIERVKRKLDVHTRIEAIILAVKSNLIGS